MLGLTVSDKDKTARKLSIGWQVACGEHDWGSVGLTFIAVDCMSSNDVRAAFSCWSRRAFVSRGCLCPSVS